MSSDPRIINPTATHSMILQICIESLTVTAVLKGLGVQEQNKQLVHALTELGL